MGSINYDLKKIKAFVFDVDGVLSPDSVPLSSDGEPLRMVNIKDGFAMRSAINCGYEMAIITGGNAKSVETRFSILGVKDIYMASSVKINDLKHYMEKTGLKPEEIIYVGDDIPDMEVMKIVGLPIAPADACSEVKEIALYISPKRGGEGVARDVIEQVLKVQGKWNNSEAFGW